MVALRNEAMRQVAEIKSLKAGTLSIAAHGGCGLSPAGGARTTCSASPTSRSASTEAVSKRFHDRSSIGRSIWDSSRKSRRSTSSSGWKSTATRWCIASPKHPLAGRDVVTVKDVSTEQFVLHHLCSATADKILRLFEQHSARCRVVAELWSFENIKGFVQEEVGLAIVPGSRCARNWRIGPSRASCCANSPCRAEP